MTEVERRPEPVTPEVYNAFIAGIELARVRLASSRVEAKVEHPAPAGTEIRVAYTPAFEPHEAGFEAQAGYRLEFVDTSTGEVQGTIEATFALLFNSEQAMREEIFLVFGELNLKMNSWPFVRELVQTNMARMGWPAFTLPLLKPAPPTPPAPRRGKSKAGAKKTAPREKAKS